MLGDYNALKERRYCGDYDACLILIDLQTAIDRAGLTDRQRQVLRLIYVKQYTQQEVAEALGVRQDTISRHLAIAETKIARVYEAWSRMGEGYSLSDETEGNE